MNRNDLRSLEPAARLFIYVARVPTQGMRRLVADAEDAYFVQVQVFGSSARVRLPLDHDSWYHGGRRLVGSYGLGPTLKEASLMGEDIALVEALSRYYGYSVEELTAAVRILELEEGEFVVRFTELVSFARSFGVPPADLARLIVDRGSGVEPWRTPPLPLG